MPANPFHFQVHEERPDDLKMGVFRSHKPEELILALDWQIDCHMKYAERRRSEKAKDFGRVVKLIECLMQIRETLKENTKEQAA